MPKRSYPFANPCPLQFKNHIGVKEMGQSLYGAQYLEPVYEKTAKLLFDGAKKYFETNPPHDVEEMDTTVVNDKPVPKNQMRLDTAGHIVRPENVEQHKEFKKPTVFEDLGMELDCPGNHRQCLPPNQLVISPSGRLRRPVEEITWTNEPVTNNFTAAAPLKTKNLCSICHKDNKGSEVQKCWHCEKGICCTCMRLCSVCGRQFCPMCSTLDYHRQQELSVCLQCAWYGCCP